MSTANHPGSFLQTKLLDVQGLRAFAVVSVIVFHLWPDRLSGGYLGVDIFFVISGYLISAHLRREVKRTGTVRLFRFWARRARRLLPAAMIVLLFCIVVTALWVPITGRQSIYNQILAAGAYFLNWFLAATSLNYFTSGSSWSPVTHYWSLSAEEQFYIVWPLLIVVALLIMRKRSQHARNLLVLVIFSAVACASFAWACFSVSTQPAAAYFETTGHAWEFAVGGLLTFVPRPKKLAAPHITWLSWAAWSVLFVAIFTLNADSGFPGPLALIPVAATMFIIWASDSPNRFAPSQVLAFRPVQSTGDISYSLYLWHWPLIFAAPLILHRGLTAVDKVVIVAITIAIAYLSKRFVEDPVRTSKVRIVASTPTALALTAVSVALLVGATSTFANQMDQRARTAAESLYQSSLKPGNCFGAQSILSGDTCANSHVLTSTDSVLVDWAHQINGFTNGTACQADRAATTVLKCSFGVPEGTQKLNVALIGDSHAGMWATALGAISKSNGLRVTTYLESGCPASLDPDIALASGLNDASGCRAWREAAINEVAQDPKITTIVTSSKDLGYVVAPDAQGHRPVDSGQGYVEAWQKWLTAGKKVIVINEVPEYKVTVPQCIARQFHVTDACAVPSSSIDSRGPLARAAEKIHNPNFEFLDFHHVFCDASLCHVIIGGIPAYMDSDHLSPPFARSFAGVFARVSSLGGTGHH
jgi:peptidoglycan/LPS O-acetylase OafA/YrhL